MDNRTKTLIVCYLWNIFPIERIKVKRHLIFLDGEIAGRAKNYRFDMKGMGMEYQPHDPVEKYYFTGTINKGVLENLTKEK